MIGGIKDAIVEILEENPGVSEWATGGIHVRRAPPMPQENPVRLRDRYLVIRVSDCNPEHVQVGPAQLTTDRIEISVWAKHSTQADEGANLVRKALDGVPTNGVSGSRAGIEVQ